MGTQSTLKGGVKIDSVARKRDLFVFSIIHPYSRYGFFLYTIIINTIHINVTNYHSKLLRGDIESRD